MDPDSLSGQAAARSQPPVPSESGRESLQPPRKFSNTSRINSEASSIRSGTSSTMTKSIRSSTYSTFSVSSRGTFASTNTSIDPSDFDRLSRFEEDGEPPQLPAVPNLVLRKLKSDSRQLTDALDRATPQGSRQNGATRSKKEILTNALHHIKLLEKRNYKLQQSYDRQVQGCRDAASAHNARLREWNALKVENELLKNHLHNTRSPLRNFRDKAQFTQTVGIHASGTNISNEEDLEDETQFTENRENTPASQSIAANMVDVEEITRDSWRGTVTAVMEAFKEMMGVDSSSLEEDSEFGSSADGSTSSRCSESREEVRNDWEQGLDADEAGPSQTCEGTAAENDSGQQLNAPSNQRNGSATQDSRKRIRNNSPTDESNDGHQKRQRSQSLGGPDMKEPAKRFACPYHKRWPQVQPRHQSCVFPGFATVHRMKEHLYRNHALPIQCHNCFQSFDDDVGLTQHFGPPSQCPGFGERPRFGFTRAQGDKLKKRSRGMSEEQRWIAAYRILFQDDDEALSNIPSPYWEYAPGVPSQAPSGDDASEASEQFQRAILTEFVRERVRQLSRAQQAINVELLLSQLPEIIRAGQDEIRNLSQQPRQEITRDVQPPAPSHERDDASPMNIIPQRPILADRSEAFEVSMNAASEELPAALSGEPPQQPRAPSIPDSHSADSGYGGSAENTSQTGHIAIGQESGSSGAGSVSKSYQTEASDPLPGGDPIPDHLPEIPPGPSLYRHIDRTYSGATVPRQEDSDSDALSTPPVFPNAPRGVGFATSSITDEEPSSGLFLGFDFPQEIGVPTDISAFPDTDLEELTGYDVMMPDASAIGLAIAGPDLTDNPTEGPFFGPSLPPAPSRPLPPVPTQASAWGPASSTAPGTGPSLAPFFEEDLLAQFGPAPHPQLSGFHIPRSSPPQIFVGSGYSSNGVLLSSYRELMRRARGRRPGSAG